MNKLTKFVCALISISIIACSSVTIAMNTPSSNNQPLTNPEAGTEPSSSVLYGTLTGNETYPAIFLHERGESLIIIDEPGTDRIRGVIFSSPKTPTAVIYVNEKGLPDTAIFGENILIYSNYTDTTVDVTVISPDGTVAENPGLEYETELLGYMDISKIPSTNNISWKTMTTKDLFWYLKLGAIVVSVFACLKATILVAPVGLLCLSAILKIAPEWLKAEDPNNPLVQPLEKAGTALDVYQCYEADLDSCKDLVVEGAEKSTVEAEQIYEKQKWVVDEIKLKSSKTPIAGVISCSDSRLTPEEKANCGTHTYSLAETLFPACDSTTNYEPPPAEITLTVSFGKDFFTFGGSKFYLRIGNNQYQLKYDAVTLDNLPITHIFTSIFTADGFIKHYAYIAYDGTTRDCHEIIYTRK